MTRTCFVIMPFSSTTSCTEAEWTRIYEEVFKPAVEGAGLDYSCRRSAATRGNIVRSILQDLKEAYVVIADLTDQNPNVFYELGVRHTVTDRSIILVQDREHIPFDLRHYANHVYEWRTEEGPEALAHNLRRLLAEVDDNPDRADNPVSDFLGRTPSSGKDPDPLVTPSEVPHSAASRWPWSGGAGCDRVCSKACRQRVAQPCQIGAAPDQDRASTLDENHDEQAESAQSSRGDHEG